MRTRCTVGSAALLLAIILALAGCMPAGCTARQDGQPAPGSTPDMMPESAAVSRGDTVADLTLMVYMVGSNLESENGAATADMQEMAESGFDADNANLVLCTGGSQQWFNDVPADRNAILRFNGEGFTQDEAWELRSMGDPALLSDFLTYSRQHYPADNYALILWNHGSGPAKGFGSDKLFDGDSMSLREFSSALEASPFGPDDKLEWIGFDACLMCSLELATTIDDYAEYLIASEEIEPYFGWNYNALSTWQPGQSGALTLQNIASVYMDSCLSYFEQRPRYTKDVTICCLDLSGANALETSVNALFSAMQADMDEDLYSSIAKLRSVVKTVQPASRNAYDLVDLGDMLDVFCRSYPEETAAVRKAYEDMTLAYHSNVDDLSGISLWFPFDNKETCANSLDAISALHPDSGQAGFLNGFTRILLDDEAMADWAGNGSAELELSDDNAFVWQLTEAQAENFSRAAYYIFQRVGEEYVMLYASKDVTLGANNELTAIYNSDTIAVVDETTGQKHYGLVIHNEQTEKYSVYTIFGLVEMVGDEDSELSHGYATHTVKLRIRENRQTGETVLLDALLYEDGAEDGKTVFDLSDPRCKTLRLLYLSNYITYDENGELLPYFEWTSAPGVWYDPLEATAPMHTERTALVQPESADAYYCQIIATDTQGNQHGSALLPIEIEPAAPSPDGIPNAAAAGYTPPQTVITAFDKAFSADYPSTVYSDENMEISFLSAAGTDYQYKLHFIVRNKTDHRMSFSTEHFMINGYAFPNSIMESDVEAGASAACSVSVEYAELADAGITEISKIELMIRGYDFQSFGDVVECLSNLIRIKCGIDITSALNSSKDAKEYCAIRNAYTGPEAARKRLFEMDGFVCYFDRLFRAPDGTLYVLIQAVNNTQLPMTLEIDSLVINGLSVDPIGSMYDAILPGSMAMVRLKVRAADLEMNGITEVSTIEFAFDLKYLPQNERYAQTEHFYPECVTVTTNASAQGGDQSVSRMICESGGVSISVSELKDTLGRYGEQAFVQNVHVENQTDSRITVCISDVMINGVACETLDTYVGEYMTNILSGTAKNGTLSVSLDKLHRAGMTKVDSITGMLYVMNVDQNAYIITPMQVVLWDG